MARQCSICCHSQRAEIEAAIVSNDGYQRIATRFSTGEMSFSESAVRRHKQNCMRSAIEAVHVERTERLMQVVEEETSRQSAFVWNVLSRIEWLDRQIRLVYEKANTVGDLKVSISALSEYRQQTKLFDELLAGQEPGQAEKLEAEWILIREAIFTALEPYPDARLAVARALLALRNRDDYQSDRQLLQAEPSDSIS